MTNVRDIMTPGAECASVNDTLVEAARKMRDLDVGALPICGDDSKLAGMITDRDIVIRGLAADRDPSTAKVADLADGTPVTVGADDSVEEALATMSQHGVRRLPVIDTVMCQLHRWTAAHTLKPQIEIPLSCSIRCIDEQRAIRRQRRFRG